MNPKERIKAIRLIEKVKKDSILSKNISIKIVKKAKKF